MINRKTVPLNTRETISNILSMKRFFPTALLLFLLATFAQAASPALDGTSVIRHGCREVEAVQASLASN